MIREYIENYVEWVAKLEPKWVFLTVAFTNVLFVLLCIFTLIVWSNGLVLFLVIIGFIAYAWYKALFDQPQKEVHSDYDEV